MIKHYSIVRLNGKPISNVSNYGVDGLQECIARKWYYPICILNITGVMS
jgi:hypothetical protein